MQSHNVVIVIICILYKDISVDNYHVKTLPQGSVSEQG
jgi:hypothetical protein